MEQDRVDETRQWSKAPLVAQNRIGMLQYTLLPLGLGSLPNSSEKNSDLEKAHVVYTLLHILFVYQETWMSSLIPILEKNTCKYNSQASDMIHYSMSMLGEGMNEVMNSTSDEKEELESKDLLQQVLNIV